MEPNPQREAARNVLRRWGAKRKQLDDGRDGIVLRGLSLGLTKEEVHVLTGLGRSTIERILARADR